jgi:hypothetical protein
MWIAGFPGATVTDIHFSDCTIRGVNAPDVISHADSISFKNVTVEPARKARSANSVPAAK